MRIATLCGMGFGTSMMLKLDIDRMLKEEGIEATVMPWDLGSFKGQHADLIVAASDMESNLAGASAKLVLIRNLVDKDEIRTKLLEAIAELEGGA